MNKIILIALISLSLVLAGQKYKYKGCEEANSCNCHPSCICDEGSSICKACRLTEIGSVFDEFQRSCPCPAGYYTSSMDPFQCSKLLVPNSQNSACQMECQLKIKDIILNTNCYFCNIDGKSYVVSEVSLNFNGISIANECKSLFAQIIQYLHPKYHVYVELPIKYYTNGSNGSLTIKIPLIDIFDLTNVITIGTSQISQQLNLLSKIGTKEKYIKTITWAICIYTNRDSVQVFQFDVDIQQTSQDCEDCIVIADLDTVGSVYTDNTFTTAKVSPYTYLVGDYFYAKITFADSSYTKFLKFISLYYKNDLGQVFDYSSITVHSWQSNGLTIALPLSEPSHPAMIQVTMQIDPISGGRFLQAEGQQNKQKQNFSFGVSQENDQPDNTSKASSSIIFLGLVNLITLSLLM